jgi:DNA modification methylase
MVTKQEIYNLKTNDLDALYSLLNNRSSNNDIVYILDNLGRLPNKFDSSVFVPLLNSNNESIRYLAIKNIGKISNNEFIEHLIARYKIENNSKIRREIVSSIGRMRSKEAIPVLINLLNDEDPKVVLQAIRALLVFKTNPEIKEVLLKLRNHPNETIQYVINKEYCSPSANKGNTIKHVEFPSFMKNVVVHGDVRDILAIVPDDSVHLTFTSPPYYNARDYSTYQSYDEYLKFLETVFKEVYRITKEGRFFLLNTSPIIIPRFSRQHSSKRYPIPFDIHPLLIKMGWEFIDDIIWLKPEASAKNRNAGFLQHRKPLAYKPNPVTEYVMVYRKKTDKLLDWAIHQYDWEVVNRSRVKGEYETSNVWQIDPTFDKKHSAVFPIELCNKIIQYYSFEGDLVFDPFAGSGTVGCAAIKLNRYFFLTEKEQSYIDLINTRLNDKPLFVNTVTSILEKEDFKKLSNGESI